MAEKAGKKAGGDSSASVKKSQLLIALKEEVLKLRNEVKEESAAREQISEWISETLKPGLQRMKSQWGSQLEELQGVIQKQQEEMAELKCWVRENAGKAAPTSKDRGGNPSFSSEALSELRQELQQEKIARQQLTLWIKQHFGRKMEVLDRRILKLCDKHQKALSNGEDPVSAVAGPPPLPSSVQEWLMQIGYDRYQEHFRGMSLAQASRLNEKTLIRMDISFKRHRTDILESAKNLRHIIEQHEQARNVERSKSQSKGSVSDAEQSDAEGDGNDVDPFADVVEGSVPELERQRQEFQEKERKLEEEKQRWLEEQKQLWLEEERERIRQEERRKLAKQQQQLQQQQDLILKQQQLLEQQAEAHAASKSEPKQTSQEYSAPVRKTQQQQQQQQQQQPTQKAPTTVSSRSIKAAVLPVAEESPTVSSSSSSDQSAAETEDVSVPEVSSDSEETSNAPMSKAEREAAEREEMAMRALRQRQNTEKQRQGTSFIPSTSSAATNKKPTGSISDRLNNKVKNDSFLALSEEEFLSAPKKSQPVTSSSTAKSTSTAKSSSQKQTPKIEEPEPEEEQDVEEDKPTTTRPSSSSSSASKKAKSREVPISDFEDEEAEEEEVAVKSAPSPQRSPQTSPATKRKNASSSTTTTTPTTTTSSSSSTLKTSSSSVSTKDAPSNKPSGSAALDKAVFAVKNDENPLNWVLFSYDKASNSVVVECSGMEGYDELMESLDDTKVQYGLLRLIDEITNRVKFVMITWMGPKVPVLTKARSNTKKAEALKAISPVNVEIIAEGTKENLTLENIWTQIKAKVDF